MGFTQSNPPYPDCREAIAILREALATRRHAP